MDKLKKTIELIESYQNILDHYVVDPGVKLTVREMFETLLAEIEQLKKEKEWLMTTLSKETGCWGTFEEMQQALKEEQDDTGENNQEIDSSR